MIIVRPLNLSWPDAVHLVHLGISPVTYSLGVRRLALPSTCPSPLRGEGTDEGDEGLEILGKYVTVITPRST
jgi:hypothetical protein